LRPDCKPLALARHGLSQRGGTIAVNERLGRVDIVGWIFEQAPFLSVLLDSELLLGLAFLALTTAVMASGVPGALMPISFSSGALLGGWLGMAVVIAGSVLGSHALFVVTRRWLAERLRRRWGERLERFDRNMAKRGFYYLLGLRLVGAPHVLVTASSALSAIRARSFALATLLGFLPAIALAAMAGSAV
jgi:uncharacterized membrane protein YdjX (TVP38/TMEM64 family)